MRRNWFTAVHNRENNPIVISLEFNGNVTALRCKLDGILNHIEPNLAQHFFIAENDDILDIKQQIQVFLFPFILQKDNIFSDLLANVDAGLIFENCLVFDLG